MFGKVFSLIPLFLIVMLLYLVMAFIGVNFNLGASPLFELELPSGELWSPSWSGIFIMVGVITLYFEIIKSTSTGMATSIEHMFSMGVFLFGLMLFLFNPPATTSTFLILTLMSLLDVVAGFTITVAAARRDFNMGGN